MSLEETLDKLEPEVVAVLLVKMLDMASVETIIHALGHLADIHDCPEDRRRFMIRSLVVRLAKMVMHPDYVPPEETDDA